MTATEGYGPRIASRYDDEIWELVPTGAEALPATRAFVQSLPAVGAALDLGCGDGRLTGDLEAERVVAADVSARALGHAKQRLGDWAEFVETDPDEDLPFGDNDFDLVLLADVLEHVRDVQLLLSEVRRILKPGGEVAISTPSVTRASLLLRGPEPPFSPHLRFFSKRTLRETLDALGFGIDEVRGRRGTLYARAIR